MEMNTIHNVDENRNITGLEETDRMLFLPKSETKLSPKETIDVDEGEDCLDGGFFIEKTVTEETQLNSQPRTPDPDILGNLPDGTSLQNDINENIQRKTHLRPREKKYKCGCDCSTKEIIVLCFCSFLIILAILAGVVLITVFKNTSLVEPGIPPENTTSKPTGEL